jgi:DNA invertase Pin-like site-specific DNA recombinase
VHIVKGHLVLDGSLQATITATILGLAAQIEREFIAARTKEALARRKAQGLPLGRPKGPTVQVKLDSYKDQIVTYLQKGVSKRSIARILECSPSTLYAWLRRQRIPLRRA